MIRYRFFSAKDYDTVLFEGPGLHVWELKDEISSQKKLYKASDFELVLYNAQTQEEYTDDQGVVPKHTSIIVKRLPRKGRFYKPYQERIRPTFSNLSQTTANASALPKEEEARIQAMAKASSEGWQQQMDIQQKMSDTRPPSYYASHSQPQQKRVPHPSYICYRCGDKGHFIADCPLMMQNPHDHTRIRRVTGIPKSFLKPAAEDSTLKKTMISYDGSKVVFAPNTSEWEKFASLVKDIQK